MEWIEKLVSEMSSRLSDMPSGNRGLLRLTSIAIAIDSKRFKREAVKELKNAFRTELSQYIASGSIPANTKHTEEILHHHRRIDELVLLSTLPLDAQSRGQVARAISDERIALGDSYYTYIEQLLDRLK